MKQIKKQMKKITNLEQINQGILDLINEYKNKSSNDTGFYLKMKESIPFGVLLH